MTSERRLNLAPGVHLAWTDRRLVALDVLGDRYFRVDRERSSRVGELLQTAAGTDALQALRTRGLMQERRRSEGENPWQRALGRQPIDVLSLAGVVGACRWAGGVLKRQRFCDVVRAVSKPRNSTDERLRLLEAAHTFLVHRPLYPRDYACMFEALALLRYLEVRGLSATWMFGVRGAPFSAHCWLESDGAVLNDDPDVVAAYKVIMGV